MTADLAPHYLVDSEGRCFYPLTNPVFGSDDPVGQVCDDTGECRDVAVQVSASDGGPGHSYHRNTWYITSEPVTAFLFNRQPKKVPVQFRLKDETAASLRFPLTLSPAEYEAKRTAEDPDDDQIGMVYHMYRPITEDQFVQPYVLDVSAMVPMTGEGDENGSWGWEVERTAGLIYGSWYHHLLPGTLLGVRERLAAALSHRYGKYEYFAHRDGFNIDSHGKFQIRKTLEFDVPVFKTKSRYGSRGQKLRGTEKVHEFIPLDLEWTQGTKITANTKAEAVAAYGRVEADLFDWIDSHYLTVCSHCKGDGYVKKSEPKS